MTTEPLDLEAAERRIYAPDAPYTHIVLREVPLLLAEIRRLRGLEGAWEATGGPESDDEPTGGAHHASRARAHGGTEGRCVRCGNLASCFGIRDNRIVCVDCADSP